MERLTTQRKSSPWRRLLRLGLFRRRPRTIGLALSGGAARGAAHIGVVRALEEAGLRPDVVTGTSVGAAIGACVAAGLPAAEISRLFRAVRWPNLAHLSLRSRLSLFDTGPLEKLIDEALQTPRIEDLARPFAAIACDITTGRRVVLRSGPLARAIRASTAIPALFRPVEHDAALLVDGGVVDNLPVEAARELGADYVIAVDVLPPPAGKRRPSNPIEMLLLATDIRSHATHPDPATVDCYVTPDVAEFSWVDFRDAEALEARGRAAMAARLTHLLNDLGRPPR